MTSYHDDVYAAVARVPRGAVTTYGRIARMTPVPSGARGVGWALAALPPERDDDVPWWRVVSASGHITNVGNGDLQRHLLEAEGVTFDEEGRVDLSTCLWSEPETEQLLDRPVPRPRRGR